MSTKSADFLGIFVAALYGLRSLAVSRACAGLAIRNEWEFTRWKNEMGFNAVPSYEPSSPGLISFLTTYFIVQAAG